MTTDFPTASAGTSQAPSAAVEKSHSASHTEIRTLPQSLCVPARWMLGCQCVCCSFLCSVFCWVRRALAWGRRM